MLDNPFIAEVDGLFDGDFFHPNLSSSDIPQNILKLVAPDFANCFEVIPVAFDFNGVLYLATTADNFNPDTLFTIQEIEIFLSDKWGCNCRVLLADKTNIRNALQKYYPFSADELKSALIKYYDFDRITFDDFAKMLDWANKYSCPYIEKSLVDLADTIDKIIPFVPVDIALKFSVIPIALEEDGTLILATSSSRSFDIIKKISEILKRPCKAVLTLDDNIRAALAKFYDCYLLKKNYVQRKIDFLFEGETVDYEIFDKGFSRAAFNIVPIEIALKFNLVPLTFDSDGTLILITSSTDTIKSKDFISKNLQSVCKIVMTDFDTLSDILDWEYGLSEKISEPSGNWANLQWRFLLAQKPFLLLELKNSGDYDSYFAKFQAEYSARFDKMVNSQLLHEGISPDDFGLIENVRSQCREFLIAEISQTL